MCPHHKREGASTAAGASAALACPIKPPTYRSAGASSDHPTHPEDRAEKRKSRKCAGRPLHRIHSPPHLPFTPALFLALLWQGGREGGREGAQKGLYKPATLCLCQSHPGRGSARGWGCRYGNWERSPNLLHNSAPGAGTPRVPLNLGMWGCQGPATRGASSVWGNGEQGCPRGLHLGSPTPGGSRNADGIPGRVTPRTCLRRKLLTHSSSSSSSRVRTR